MRSMANPRWRHSVRARSPAVSSPGPSRNNKLLFPQPPNIPTSPHLAVLLAPETLPEQLSADTRPHS